MSATHKLKIQEPWASRVRSGQKRAEIRKHDRDFQAGDLLELVPSNEYGTPLTEYVERDDRGRFVHEWRRVEPIHARITHVLPGAQFAALADDYCVLSIEVQS